MAPTKVTTCSVRDVRFPTSLNKDGSDALHTSPDYSAAYVILKTDSDLEGHGMTFTLGRGNDIVCYAIRALSDKVVGRRLDAMFADFAAVWRSLTSDDQMRWLGPEKGVTHLAVAALTNALWDLWAKMAAKPLWKMLVDMEPEQLVSTIDFRYMADALTKQEALDILKKMRSGRQEREARLRQEGFPAYTTSCAWSGYPDPKLRQLCREALAKGFTRFKAKVGVDVESDRRRLRLLREEIGPDRLLMLDANQAWEVDEAIAWMWQLAEFKPLWIEEPTSPDDILGHRKIAEALQPLGIAVATGEHCHNRVMFKQLLAAGALHFCQIDSCRLGGVSENLAVILMAAKYRVPVVPHAGGVGLCEMVQHLAMFDFVAVSGTMESRFIEFADHLHEHYENPVTVDNGSYVAPSTPGYSVVIKPEVLDAYEWPSGGAWQRLFQQGLYPAP